MSFEGDDWMVRSRIFSREDEPVSDNYDDGDDDFLVSSPPTTPFPRENIDGKPKKTTLDKQLEKLASLKMHPPPRAVSAAEFASNYGLPRLGRNPHHLKTPGDLHEKDITDAFGPAKGRNGRSGYHYGECKDEVVVARICEIFPVVYLRNVPKSKLIAKQFARGIIMEKHKNKPVSWADFAGTSNKNQRGKWLKKVQFCLAAIAELTGANEKELYKLEGIDGMFHDPTAGNSPTLRKSGTPREVEEEVHVLIPSGPEREKDINDIMDLMRLVGLQLHAITEDYVSTGKQRVELSNKAAQEEGVMRKTEAKVAKFQKVLANPDEAYKVLDGSGKNEAYNEMVRDARIDYEAAELELEQCSKTYEHLQCKQTCLRRQFDALSLQLAHLKRGELGVYLKPRPMCSMFDQETCVSVPDPIVVRPCALCLSTFPLKDIIVCTCGHLYHPWCAGVWFRVASTCADTTCSETVHPNWFRSFGFGHLHVPLKQLVQSMELEKERELLLVALTSATLESHPNIDPKKVYIEQSSFCTWTQSMGGTESIGVTETGGPMLSLSRTGGTQSLGNNSAAGSGLHWGESSKHLGKPFPDRGLPCIDEVDSPEKLKPAICTQPVRKDDIDGGSQKAITTEPPNSDYTEDFVTEPIVPGLEGSLWKPAPEEELEDRLRKLKEEAADFERFQKLREEVAELERLKKLRQEDAQSERKYQLREDSRSFEFDESRPRSQGQTRALIKVPQPPPLPPIIDKEQDTAGTTKRKTRSEIAAEAAAKEAVAKEAEEGKKKSKKPKKNQRITPLG